MSEAWPAGVPESLWNYGRMQIQDLLQVPMMGVQVSKQFEIAFVAGFLFVGYVAWDRFTTVQTEADGFNYRVMREVGVADLGGASALWRARSMYIVTMLALYVAFTFFGKLIVQTVNSLNVVGIRVDSASLEFDSPQWPLLLAFGFAGLAPLIPQLRAAEGWLFRRAYRAVGIPVRIDQTTQNLLDLLSSGNPEAVPLVTKEIAKRSDGMRKRIAPSWVGRILGSRDAKLDNAMKLLAELELLIDLARGARGAWPNGKVSRSVRGLESKIAKSAEDLLDDLFSRLNEQAGTGDAAKGTAAESASDQRSKYVDRTLESARELRDELVAVLAVYVERDPEYDETLADGRTQPKVTNGGLRELLERADPPNQAGTGPELGVLAYIGLCAPLYALFAWQGLHPLLSNVASPSDPQVVLATTLLEMLRLLSIFWFPLLAAFGVRQSYCDDGTWVYERSHNSSAFYRQRIAALTLGFTISVACLVGLAALWAFFIAKDVTAFRNNLFFGAPPLMLFYPTMAVISLPVMWCSLAGADARARIDPVPSAATRLEERRVAARGVACGLLVGALHITHMGSWWGWPSCTLTEPFLIDIYYRGCFQYYGALDFFTMPLLVFLCVVMFGEPFHVGPTAPATAPTGGSQVGGGVGATPPVTAPKDGNPVGGLPGTAVPVALVILVLWATAGLAQDGGAVPPTTGAGRGTDIVRIGFRTDAEPFSYRSDQESNTHGSHVPQYKGFLADLCYWIFDGSRFEVEESAVTAANRFAKLSLGEIDVLCDPVTMRFSDEKRTASGTYSPIVFATGISYLRRPNRAPAYKSNTLYVGYVEGTTARRVAQHACRIDLFNVVGVDERRTIDDMCHSATVVRDIEELITSNGPGAKLPETLRVDALAAATAEKKGADAAKGAAGAKKVPLYEKAVERWEKAVKYLGGCGEWCWAKDVATDFGNLCNDAEPADRQDDEWRPTLYRFCAKPDHATLIDWFCRDRAAPPKVYLGDREIILGKLRTWNAHEPVRCDVESDAAGANLTYEPYALMTAHILPWEDLAAAMRREEITRLVQRRVYEFFSFGALARGQFDAYFLAQNPDWKMSVPLAYMFALNGVDEEWELSLPTDDAD